MIIYVSIMGPKNSSLSSLWIFRFYYHFLLVVLFNYLFKNLKYVLKIFKPTNKKENMAKKNDKFFI